MKPGIAVKNHRGVASRKRRGDEAQQRSFWGMPLPEFFGELAAELLVGHYDKAASGKLLPEKPAVPDARKDEIIRAALPSLSLASELRWKTRRSLVDFHPSATMEC